MKRKALIASVGVAVLGAAGLLWFASPSGARPRANREEETRTTSLPIGQVVLYSSGVGYFQRQGQVEGTARVDLSFPVSDINDLLKSMVLRDLDGGHISVVSYDSNAPIDRTLKSFAVNLTANPGLADILNQARGEKVEVALAQGAGAAANVSGTIVGVEKQRQTVGKEVVEVSVLNLWCSDGLRGVKLAEVQRIRLLSATLEKEFKAALETLGLSHDTQKKAVSIRFVGEGKRQVRVGYVVDNPMWKTSYRLVLPSKKQESPYLQGWAVVENPSDEDWKDVRMALVSGRPISFRMDLYTPLYVPRPTVVPELFASLRPVAYSGSLQEQPLFGPPGWGRSGARRQVTFSMSEKPWSSVFAWLSEQTGKPVIVSSKPTGSFSFNSPDGRKYTVPEVVDIINQALLSAEKTNKYYLINGEKAFTLIPADEKIDISLLPRITPDQLDEHALSEVVVMSVWLRSAVAEDLAGELKPLLGPFGRATAVKASNQLVLQDTVGNLKRIKATIEKIDRPLRPSTPVQLMSLSLGTSVVSAASESRLGDYFQYALDRPVSLPRQKSALLPIVGKDVQAQRVSIYNEGTQVKFPLLGLRFKNTSGLHLMQGPITVFEGSRYAGDARILDLQPNEQRLVSYAVDLGTEVDAKPSPSSGRITSVTAVKGLLHTSTRFRDGRSYTVKNRNDQERTLLIEHPVRHDFKLVQTPKPVETASDVYRFELKLPAGASKTLSVTEERDISESYQLSNIGDQQIKLFLQSPVTSAKVKAGLKQAMSLRWAVAKTQREIAELQRQLNTITQDQVRLRANLKEMPSTAKAYKRYLDKFDQQESQIEKYQQDIKKFQSTEHEQQKELEEFLASFSAE
jgi:hypothetical protein